MGSLEKIWI